MGINRSEITYHAWWVILVFLTGALTSAVATPVSAQAGSNPIPPNQFPSCGWHSSQNASGIVASSAAGSAVVVTVGEPSWDQACFSFPGLGGSTSSTSFPAYEVFPITVQAPPGATIKLEAGAAIPTAEQIAVDGVRNSTIWTWFNPDTVETDSSGVGRANFTLAGAVMPFVVNDISNVTLPIMALASTGVNGSAGLPIEFEGGVTNILQSPGPIAFGKGIGGQAGSASQPLFSVVYSPPNSGPPNSAQTTPPVQVNMQVLGTYQNGSVGPLPSDVQISFPQPSFELQPNSVFYFAINEINSLKPSNASIADTYTFAVQEKVDNGTYVEPLTVTVSLEQVFFGGATTTSETTPASTPGAAPLGSAAGPLGSPMAEGALILGTVALVVILTTAVALRRRGRTPPKQEEVPTSSGPPPPP
jgi:hypothetical protein